MPAAQRDHYDRQYRVRAAEIRRQANADSATVCWRCGRTMADERLRHPGRRVSWQAGHTIDGDNSAPLLPEHSTCNQRAGQALSSARRRTSGGTGRF